MPKKKGGKKGAKIVDGIATSEMTREQLVGHCRRIQMELDREREERNFFMLEREKLFALWNITMEQLHAQKMKAQLAVEQMAEHDQEKQLEVLMQKQKLRHLLTEKSKKVDEARLQNLRRMQKGQDDMLALQTSLKETVNQKSKELQQTQMALHELLHQLKLENVKKISEVKNDVCMEIARLERDFLRMTLEREKRDEVAYENERELLKNKHKEHIEQVKDLHGAEMKKIKNYFHLVTTNNLATVVALQDEIKEMKGLETQIIGELHTSKKELGNLEQRIRSDEEHRKQSLVKEEKLAGKIQNEFNRMKEMQKRKDKYTRTMEITNEVLLQKVKLVDSECKVFKRTLTTAILEMQQEAAMKRMILELKLKAATQVHQQERKILPISSDADVGSNTHDS